MTSLSRPLSFALPGDLAERLNGAPHLFMATAENEVSKIHTMVRQTAVSIAMGSNQIPPGELALLEGPDVHFALRYDPSAKKDPFQLSITTSDSSTDALTLGLLLDLITAAHQGPYQLRRCFHDSQWFSPGLRSARSKFCSPRCRNRFNYELRSQGSTFVCADCKAIYSIGHFSGLAHNGTPVEPAGITADEPICVDCATRAYTPWAHYLSIAELFDEPSDSMTPSSTDQYARQLNAFITEALSAEQHPVHYQRVADQVMKRCKVRGKSPALTVLGYLLKNPSRYCQVDKNVFSLSETVIPPFKPMSAQRRPPDE